ncbi:MAG TPA: hypothetical protein VJB82_05040 [Candidatus Peribacterales bacterium]|nr:hypothetical protein [Candidatus Peribacterales bacterium]
MNPQPQEQLIRAFSTHWIKYWGPAAAYVVLTGTGMLLFFLAIMAAYHAFVLSQITFIAGLIITLGIHHWFFHFVLSDSMDDIIITNRRVIFLDVDLLFCDDIREIQLEHIIAVEARKHGLLQNIFLYGTLWFDTGGSEMLEGRTLPLVPRPHSIANEITILLQKKNNQ